MTLAELHVWLSERLEEIADEMPPQFDMSLLARHRTNRDSHILISNESLAELRQALLDLERDGTQVFDAGRVPTAVEPATLKGRAGHGIHPHLKAPDGTTVKGFS